LPALAIVAGAVSLESRAANLLPRWLLGLGDASYSIYLTHGFALPVLGLVVVFLHGTGLPAEALTILACVAVSSIVGWVAYKVVERPMMLSLKTRFA
jgi:peptidoglycan/LPS O-acetylase OafA/YrhL